MNPIYPIYVISKGRWETRLTARSLERMAVPYHIVIEPQEYEQYARVIDPEKILTLPFSNLGLGSIPVRNWVWEHSMSIGAKRHWVLDDNMHGFYRLNHNYKVLVDDGTIFRAAESYVDRYENVAIAGFEYDFFAKRKWKWDPRRWNARIYSCILIKNDIASPAGEPYRWRGRYNEDTDLSLRVLKDKWCTVLFLAFLAGKAQTMTVKGGNTDVLYSGAVGDEEHGKVVWNETIPAKRIKLLMNIPNLTYVAGQESQTWDALPVELRNALSKYNVGRLVMAQSLVDQHPDVARVSWKFGRWQHHVDYSPFIKNERKLREDVEIPDGIDNFGMFLREVEPPVRAKKERFQEPEPLPLPRAEVIVDNSGPLPSLDDVPELSIDTETSAERDFYKHKLAGISYYLPDGRKGYLPINHPGGGNLDTENVRRWAQTELRDKWLITANAGHEVDTFLRFGVDLEAQNCNMRDVFNQAALVDDHRTTIMECHACGQTYKAIMGCCECGCDEGHSLGRLNLDVLAREELKHKMLPVDHMKLFDMPADQVAPVAIEDAEITWQLNEHFRPIIEDEGLGEVLDLEDDLTFCVSEMERNGTYLDIEKLARFKQETKAEWEQRILAIKAATGIEANLGGWKGMQKLFDHLKLDYGLTAAGTPSFPEDFLLTVKHPVVQLALESRQLASVQSKFLDPYLALVSPEGLLRYNLHQLAGDEKGTITGRFSASNVNIQQVSKNSKQPKLLRRWPIRSCFIPGPEDDGWLSGDASQIEFRLFAHYAAKFGRTRLAEKYRDNPWIDFHQMVSDWTGVLRDFAKNVNFCKLYGGGPEKIAYMINSYREPGTDEVSIGWVKKHVTGPYEKEFPEATWLMEKAQSQAETHKFVRTLLGRRRRFGDIGERYYSALNCVIQGGAADINKRKLLELYRNRKELGLTMRFTVHDEIDGGLKSRAMLPRMIDLLNQQTTELYVPIMWECKIGPNWHEAH